MPLLWIFDSSVTVSGLRIFTEPIVEPIFPQKLLFKSIQILIWTTETSTCEHQDEPGRMDNRRKAKTFIIIAKSPKLLASEKGEQFEFKRSKDHYIVLRMDPIWCWMLPHCQREQKLFRFALFSGLQAGKWRNSLSEWLCGHRGESRVEIKSADGQLTEIERNERISLKLSN